ncbi:MAG: YkgJ family cysteine cluster protein [Proteobacteria bacterium]|nr:YkgJ family cysteine cluster protein [Pseudomonadota bacterium]
MSEGVVVSSPCQACGACCATSAEWPRFSLESDEDLARIPASLVAEGGNGMACDGDRCKALEGIVGVATRCTIYEVRPEVCRACQPGDEACTMARELWGMEKIEA